MNRSWLWSGTKLLQRSAVVLVVAALGLAHAAAASAHGPDEERSTDTSAGDAQVLAAIQRDLGLTEEQAKAMLAGSAEAAELDAQLRDELGDAYAGSWLHRQTGALVVAVTDPQAARTVRESGARAKLVDRGQRQLDAVVADVEATVEAVDDAIREWYVDPEANQVVVAVQEGQEGAAAGLRAAHGDAVRIETVDGIPQPDNHGPDTWLDGGIAYAGCSTGFNVRNPSNGNRFFLTAGHCHRLAGTVPPGGTVSSHGKTVGPVTAAFYGPWDDGLVQVTNTAGWAQGPFVWTYGGGPTGGDWITISNWTDPPVGTAVCKSGRTTQVTCGTIQAKNVSVTYSNPDGSTTNLTDLVRHTACQRGGDSGGPAFVSTLSGGSWTHRAVGTNSGSNNLPNGQCRSTQGGTNITWYYPLAITLPAFSSLYGVQLW